MVYGLQVWNASSQLRLDTSDRAFLQVQYFTGTATSDPYYVSVPGMINDNWAVIDISNRRFAKMYKEANQVRLTGYNANTYNFAVMRL